MARRGKRKKKGMHPLVAVGLLACSATFAFVTLGGEFGTDTIAQLDDMIGFDDFDDEDDWSDGEQQQTVQWTDLLARHGSLAADAEVRHAFASAPDAAVFAAAPIGETAPGGGRWRGDDPPALRLGVVMVSLGSRRAVFGGEVVGVGDAIAGGQVAAIEQGVLRLRWRGRELTYDLGDDAPREFRAERDRRAAAQRVADEADGDERDTEEDR